MLWKPNLFTSEPQFTKDVWKLFDEASQGLLMGAASVTKSYSMGVRLYLEWVRDPEYTSINVVGPSEEHLEKNLFSHMVALHDKASLPQPGSVGELFIGKSRRDQLGSIKGVVIPVGKVKKAARLQGTKRKPRPEAHPVFGPLSRMFIFIDEIENVPAGIWQDIDNVLSQVDEEGAVQGFKIFGAYNPTNQQDEVGKRAEPECGWENFDVDSDYRWRSKRGWEVLRLDGEKSENVIAGKVIYPGIQTKAGLDVIARNAGGKQAAGYYTMGRGAYPPQGIELTVLTPGMLAKMRGSFIWYGDPEPCGAADLALEGGAATLVTLGLFGKATGMKLPPSIEFPKGRTVMFKGPNGQVTPRYGVQLDQQFAIEKGDSVSNESKLTALFKRAGVRPHLVALDRTGHGAGTADLMRHNWSPAIHDINYSESPSEGKVLAEDTKTCKELFDRVMSELWFGFRELAEFGYILINPAMDLTKLSQQLTQRKYRVIGGKSKVESKRDYISRGFLSPDEADSATLLVLGVRRGGGVVFSMKGGEPAAEEDGDYWYEQDGSRVDPSNRTDYLDDKGLL